MRELRAFSYLMHPPAADNPELYTTLMNYTLGFAERSGLACNFRGHRKGDKYPLALRKTALRIVREALANSYRHASATQVSVELRRIGSQLHVVVTDHGQGIASGQRPSKSGVGIQSMRMRLRKIGGRLRITQPPSGGTRLHAVLPVGRGTRA